MSKVIAWFATWACYWLGHAASQLLRWDAMAWMYPAYNWLMCASWDAQKWGGLSRPWMKGGDDGRG